jgi:hypothetical protein
VDEQRRRAQPGRVEQLDRSVRTARDVDAAPAEQIGERSGRADDEVVLDRALGHMHGERQPLARGELADRVEQRVGDRVGRVRRDADAHERRRPRAHRADGAFDVGERLGALQRIGTEDLAIRDPARTEREERVEGGVVVGGVAEGGDAARESFGGAEQRGGTEVVEGEQLALGRGERAHPVEEAEVLERTAEHGEVEMRVRVHEARREDAVTELLVASARARDRRRARAAPPR